MPSPLATLKALRFLETLPRTADQALDVSRLTGNDLRQLRGSGLLFHGGPEPIIPGAEHPEFYLAESPFHALYYSGIGMEPGFTENIHPQGMPRMFVYEPSRQFLDSAPLQNYRNWPIGNQAPLSHYRLSGIDDSSLYPMRLDAPLGQLRAAVGDDVWDVVHHRSPQWMITLPEGFSGLKRRSSGGLV